MELDLFIKNAINSAITYMAKPQVQQVISHHIPSYTLYTKTVDSSDSAAILDNVKILTPYAGNGYGVVCSPRASENIVTIPLRLKNNAVVAIGRYFTEDDQVPDHEPGDYLIHHETHSKLLFRVSQPATSGEKLRNGDLLKSKSITATKSSRIFEVELSEEDKKIGVPPLRESDFVQVYYGATKKTATGDNEETEGIANKGPGGSLYSWKSNITISEDVAMVHINKDFMDFPGLIPDYTDTKLMPDENFKIVRVPPTKGLVILEHYTGSILQYDEDPDYKIIYPKTGEKVFAEQANVSVTGNTGEKALETQPYLVRYNRNAVIGQAKSIVTKDGELVPITHHRPKGTLKLHHYSRSGLSISENEPQLRGHRLKLDINLTPEKNGSIDVYGETFMSPLPSAQILMENITQSDIDVATRVVLRHLTSAIADEKTCETDYSPDFIPQKEKGHFGVDYKNKEEISLEGSGIFMRDYLRKYNEKKKGWQFVSLSDAEEYYRENQQKYFDEPDGYKIDEKERIVPASGRRDVLLRDKDIKNERPKQDEKSPDIHDVRLVNYEKTVDEKGEVKENDKKTRTDKNKELIGQKGYTYKTQYKGSILEESTFEDGYLCYPKGDIGLRHYTRSGIEIRELEPNLDYHALQASFSLFAWDNGQYYQPYHTNDEERNFRKMKFGPYPLPLGQLLLENAKYQIPEKNITTAPAPVSTEPTTSVTSQTTVDSASFNALQNEIISITEQQTSFLKDAAKNISQAISLTSPQILKEYLQKQLGLCQSTVPEISSYTPNEYRTDAASLNESVADKILTRIYKEKPLLGQFWGNCLLAQREVLSDAGKNIFDAVYGEIKAYNLDPSVLEYLRFQMSQKWTNKDNDIKQASKHIQVTWNLNQVKFESAVKKDPSATTQEATALSDIRCIVEAQRLIVKVLLESLNIADTNTTAFSTNGIASIVNNSFEALPSTLFPVTGAESDLPPAGADKNKNMVFPTPLLSHTIHPQPDIWEDKADAERTTLALPGETATWLSLYQYSSHIQTVGKQVKLDDKRIGSRLLIRDYVTRAKPEDENSYLIAASKWENKRGEKHNLIAPKGSVELHHYTASGLTICDTRPHYLNKHGGGHAMSMRLEMRSLDFLAGIKEDKAADVKSALGELAESANTAIEGGGGDAMAKNMEGGETKAVTATPLFEKPDGSFFCEILSNELVDKGDEYAIEIDGDGRFVKEEDSVRGKLPEKPHGKRGARTGLSHDTTRTKEHDAPCSLVFEDFIVSIEKEGDELKTVLQPTHLYDELKKGETRCLIMPRGRSLYQLYNNSGLVFGDTVTDVDIAPDKLDELERGKYQLPYLALSMQAWNNMKIEEAKETPAKPFEKPSAQLIMECLADQANTEGKDATRVLLIQKSSQQNNDKELGSALLFEDYIKEDDEHFLPCHGYKKSEGDEKERLELTFPKGKIWLQSYNNSGIFIDENIKEKLDEQQISVRLAMREWDNAKPEEKGSPFDQDTAHLKIIELCPKATKEGKRAVSVNLETFTSSTNEQNPGSAFFIKDFVDSQMPSHLYDESDAEKTLKPVLFPKGELGVIHYTKSGLYVADQEQKQDKTKHRMLVSLAMQEWDNSGEGKQAKPFTSDSCSFTMEEVSPDATSQGKRASKILLHANTSKTPNSDFGSCILIDDYVTSGGEVAHVYDEGGEGLLPLKFPKGSVSVQHYTGSGLYLTEQEIEGAENHRPQVILRLHRWGENQPAPSEDVAKFFAEATSSTLDTDSSRIGFTHVMGDSTFFIEDANPDPNKNQIISGITHWGKIPGPNRPGPNNDLVKGECSQLIFEDLLPDGNAKQVMIRLHHLQSSELRFEQMTLPTDVAPADMFVQLNHSTGSVLAFEDYIGAGTHEFPKGEVHLRHYTNSGLFISDESLEQAKHTPYVRLDLKTWDKKDQEAITRFFAQITSEERTKESSRIGFTHIMGDSTFFIEDANPDPNKNQIISGITHWGNVIGPAINGNPGQNSCLLLEDLLADGEAKQVKITLRHLQNSELKLEQLTLPKNDAYADMLVHLTHQNDSKLIMTDYVDKGKITFPKGKVQFTHYTNSGLYINEKALEQENHTPVVSLDLRSWDKRDDEPISSFYAQVTSTLKTKESSLTGFSHYAGKSSFYIQDDNEDLVKNKMICGIVHCETSHLLFEDKTDSNNEQVDITLKHKKDSWLKFLQLDIDPGNMEVDLHHTKDAGLKIVNSDDDTTLTIYHPSGSKIEFDKEGNILAESVKNITAKAAEKATVEAPDIELIGNVKITGNLEITGTVDAPIGYEANAQGSWHFPE